MKLPLEENAAKKDVSHVPLLQGSRETRILMIDKVRNANLDFSFRLKAIHGNNHLGRHVIHFSSWFISLLRGGSGDRRF